MRLGGKQMKKFKYEFLMNWNLTLTCNINCIYCVNKKRPSKMLNLFQCTRIGIFLTNMIWKKVIKNIKYLRPPKTIDIKKTVSLLSKFGKPMKIKLSGGEPFLYPHFIKICKELSRVHYIGLDSNFTTNRVKLFCDTIDPKRVDLIRAALHIEELEKNKLINRFIDNVLYCKTKGFNIETLIVGYPPVLEKIHKYKEMLETKGLPFYVQPFSGHYNGKKYPEAYSQEEIEKYNLNLPYTSYNRNTKNQPCTAGYRFFVVYPSGNIHPCYQIHKKLGNIYQDFKPFDTIIKCPFDICICEPRTMNQELFDEIIKEYLSSKK